MDLLTLDNATFFYYLIPACDFSDLINLFKTCRRLYQFHDPNYAIAYRGDDVVPISSLQFIKYAMEHDCDMEHILKCAMRGNSSECVQFILDIYPDQFEISEICVYATKCRMYDQFIPKDFVMPLFTAAQYACMPVINRYAKTAEDWELVLGGAADTDNKELMDLAVQKGATFAYWILRSISDDAINHLRKYFDKIIMNKKVFIDAASDGNLDIVNYFIKKGKISGLNRALKRAAYMGQAHTVSRLIEVGAQVSETVFRSAEAGKIKITTRQEYKKVMEILIKHSGIIN